MDNRLTGLSGLPKRLDNGLIGPSNLTLSKQLFKTICLSAAMLLLTSCEQSYLMVQTDYLSYKNLASYYVGTPDPRLICPPIGQRLIVRWSVPKAFLRYKNLHLVVTIRLWDREEIVQYQAIEKMRGTYLFELMNKDYITSGGILTYKIDLVGSDCIIEEWRHQIWADLITVSHEGGEPPEQLEPAPDIDWDG